MQKRRISMVLALSMALTAMPLPALAQSAPPDTASAAALAEESGEITNIYTSDSSGKPIGDLGDKGDSWSYDETSNTLTLKNGAFQLHNYNYDSYNKEVIANEATKGVANQNDSMFSGKITKDMILKVANYASRSRPKTKKIVYEGIKSSDQICS